MLILLIPAALFAAAGTHRAIKEQSESPEAFGRQSDTSYKRHIKGFRVPDPHEDKEYRFWPWGSRHDDWHTDHLVTRRRSPGMGWGGRGREPSSSASYRQPQYGAMMGPIALAQYYDQEPYDPDADVDPVHYLQGGGRYDVE